MLVGWLQSCMILLGVGALAKPSGGKKHQGDVEGSDEFREYRKYYMKKSKHSQYPSPSPLPQFDEGQMVRTVAVPLDDPVYLHCKVKNLGGHQVAWIRQKDNHLLTVAEDVFTQDNRFQISPIVKEPIDDWTLIIRYARKSDSGSYECQLSTDPPRTIVVELNVIERTTQAAPPPTEHVAEINGDRHVTLGQDFSIQCTVKPNKEHGVSVYDDSVTWYHNNTLIDMSRDENENKYAVDKRKNGKETIIHVLTVKGATFADVGEYECKPPNTAPLSLNVSVNTPRRPSERVVEIKTYGPNPAPTSPIPELNGGTGPWRSLALALLVLPLLLVVR